MHITRLYFSTSLESRADGMNTKVTWATSASDPRNFPRAVLLFLPSPAGWMSMPGNHEITFEEWWSFHVRSLNDCVKLSLPIPILLLIGIYEKKI